MLDHAIDKAPLWDARLGITTIGRDGRRIGRHQERRAEELRLELERLLRDGHLELYEEVDRSHGVLSLDEALEIAADNRNWYSPLALGEPEQRPTNLRAFSHREWRRRVPAGANPS